MTFTDIEFVNDLVLRRYKQAKNDKTFFVDQPYRIKFKRDGIPHEYIVPKGFGTDLASVPRGFRNIASKMDGIEASVVHDSIYWHKHFPRAWADALFLAILKAGGVPWLRRLVMYSAVRVGGWVPYGKEHK